SRQDSFTHRVRCVITSDLVAGVEENAVSIGGRADIWRRRVAVTAIARRGAAVIAAPEISNPIPHATRCWRCWTRSAHAGNRLIEAILIGNPVICSPAHASVAESIAHGERVASLVEPALNRHWRGRLRRNATLQIQCVLISRSSNQGRSGTVSGMKGGTR